MAKPLPDPNLPWPVPMPVIAEIALSEGLRLRAYRCPAGKWTIGWGETDGVRPGDVCTKEQADRWLLEDTTERVREILAMCKVEPTGNELGAMLSLAYNIGLEGLRGSTVLRQHNAGNRQAAARAFGLWNKARNPNTGTLEVLDGLTARRARESALYLTPDDDTEPVRMPQAIEAESNLTKSPISQSGAVTVGAGAITAATSLTDQIGETTGLLGAVKGGLAVVKDVVHQVSDLVGIQPGAMLAIALIVAGYIVMKQRTRQRKEGWA